MKKNFFKKLSFVMALAMIVSIVAPAASAFAATTPSLYTTIKYLYLNDEGSNKINEYDFNIKNKVTGSTYKWTSSNEAVATVDAKTGEVVGLTVGKTTITCVVTLPTKKTKTLTATVKVRDNIETLAVSNAPTEAIAVDSEYNLNRSFTTFNNSTTKTSSITRWVVEGTDATIEADSGIFKATKAGTYKVTAYAFQSAARYDAWKADATANAAYVLASATAEIKVVVGITAVKVVTPKQLEITFNSDVKDIVNDKTDITVDLKLDGTYTAMVPVASFDSISADGKTVKFSVYDNLTNDKTYVVKAGGASIEKLVQIGTPVSISMENQTAPAGTAYTVKYELLDQYGVNVASLYNASVVKSSTVAFTNATTGTFTLLNGQVAFVSYSYSIINADGTINTISTGTKTITGAASTATSSFEWNIFTSAANAATAFATAKKTIKVGETGQYLNARVLMSDASYNYSGYTFESLNQGILMIDKNTSLLTALTAGSALVKVLDSNSNVVGYFNVSVTAASAVASAKASTTTVKLSNGYDVNGVTTQEYVDVTIKNVDQYATETAATIDTVNSYVANAARSTDAAAITFPATDKVRFTAVSGKTGTFVYVVKTTAGFYVSINVTVAAPGAMATYSIDATQTAIDSYVANPDTVSTLDFTVYGVDAAGFKKSLVVTGGSTTLTYSVAGPVDFTESLTDPNSDGTVTFDLNDMVDTGAENGTYTFKVAIGGVVYTKTFTVNNSRPAAEVNVSALSATVVSGTALSTVLESLIDLEISDVDQTITSATFVSGNTAVLNNTGVFVTAGTVTVYVKTVGYTNTVDAFATSADVYKSFTFTVN